VATAADRPGSSGAQPAVAPLESAPISAVPVQRSSDSGVNTPGGGVRPTGGGRPRPTTGLHAAVETPGSQTVARLGRYQIITRLATGGMAEVYLAVHGELAGFRTPVVLKKVLPHLACNPQFIDMFLDEARIASLLDHPNVVRIYEVGRSSNEYFLAMELVQGRPLSALIRRAFERQESLDHRLAAFVVAQAAAGLHHAHELNDPLGNPLGLVHRDVSPQNVLISFEGSVKVIDFGIARALGRITETQTGGMKGKFGYMSPEQARGEDVDPRTDIFALGVVLWETICGRRLFHRENDLATMRALIYDPIPKPSSIVNTSPDLESLVMRALSRNPKLRFQTGREMATALEKYVVSAGGASTADLGALMKTFFAQDIVIWQQTMRAALNTPALPDQQPTPALNPAVSDAAAVPANHARRGWILAGAAGTVVALALIGFLALRSSGKGPPPPAPGLADSQPAAPALAPNVEPLPPSSAVPPSQATNPEHPVGTASRPKPSVRRKKVSAHEESGSSREPLNTKPDRADKKPNPF
jgi:eukaryotic-like serine/threonine-protein kinase